MLLPSSANVDAATALIPLDEPLMTRAALPVSLLGDRSARSSAEADASVDDEDLSRRAGEADESDARFGDAVGRPGSG